MARCLFFFCETGRGGRTKDLVRRLRSAPSPRSISGGIFHLVARLATARGEAPLLRSRRDRSLTPSPVLCSLNKPSRYPARSSRSLAMGRQIGGQKLPSQSCLSGAVKSDRVKHHPLQWYYFELKMGSLLHLSSISRQNREMGFISSPRLPVQRRGREGVR